MAIEAAKLLVMVGAETEEAQAELSTACRQLENYGKEMMKTGGLLTAGLTVPMGLLGKKALSMGIDYDQAMGVLRQSTGASEKEMEALGKKAQELGRDMMLPGTSAGDAAEAMLELGKAGLGVNDILAASRGVLELSAAGQLSNAAAAEVTANALNAFGLAGREATRVADLFAAGANASSAEVADMADAFKMSAAVFSAAGVPIEDLTTMIAQMSNAGIQGSDAGTSLKQMLLSLQAPSKQAANLMEELGISIYDANGTMLPTESLIGQFSEKLGGLTQEERNAALAAIFGSDAVRAANVVLMGGVEANQKMKMAVTEAGAAHDLAAAQMAGLAGASEMLTNTVNTLMQDAIALYHEELVGTIQTMAKAVDWFSELDDGTKKATLGFVGLAGAIGPAMTATGGMMYVSGKLGTTLATLPTYLGEVGAGLNLLKTGSGVFETMSLGGGATAAALGTVAAQATLVTGAIAGLIYVSSNWDDWVLKPNLERLEKTSEALETYYANLIKSGAATTEVMAAYKQEQELWNRELKKTGTMQSSFIDKQGMLRVRLKETAEALALTAKSQEEYEESMQQVAESEGLSINTRGELVRTLYYYGNAVEEVVQANWLLGESEREAMRHEDARYQASMRMNEMSVKKVEAVEKEQQATLELARAQQQLAGDLDLIRDAYELGVVGFGDYRAYLEQARQQTLEFTKAQQEGLETAVLDAQYKKEIADAANKLAEAVGSAKIAQLDLAESFKGATAADYARQMIANLKDEIKETGDPAGQLGQAVKDLGLSFGMATEKSWMASEAFPMLTSAISSGIIPVEQSDAAISLFNETLSTGQLDWEKYFQTLGAAPEVYKPFLETQKNAQGSLDEASIAVDNYNSRLGNIPPTLASLAGEQMQAATKGIKDLGETALSAASAEGGVSILAAGLAKVNESFAQMAGEEMMTAAIDNFVKLADSMNEMSMEGGGLALFGTQMTTITTGLGEISSKSASLVQTMPNYGAMMQRTAEQNLTPFCTMVTDIVDKGLGPMHGLLATMHKTDLPNFQEAIKITTKTFLEPFEERVVSLAEVTIPKLVKSFEAFIGKVESARVKVNDLHKAIDDLPDHKTITIDVVVNGEVPDGEATGGPVMRGTPYIVGEEGPELFIPAEYGRILSNRQSMEAIENMGRNTEEGNGGGNTYSIHVTSLGDADSIGESVMRAIQRLEMLYG